MTTRESLQTTWRLRSVLLWPSTCGTGFVAPLYTRTSSLRSQPQTHHKCRIPVVRKGLPVRKPRSSAWRVSCVAVPKFKKKGGEADLDDPFHYEPSLTDTPQAFSGKIARTSLQALTAYYLELCRQQPFIARRLVASILSIITAKLVGITIPLLLKRIIDLLMANAGTRKAMAEVSGRAFRLIVMTILLHAAARLLASAAHEIRSTLFARGGQRIGRSITATTFGHIHSLEAAFHNASRTGAVTRVIDRGTRSIMTVFRSMIFNFMPTLLELILVCSVLVRGFSPLYVIVTLLTFVAFVAWTMSINDRMGVVRAELNAAENDASAKLTDSLMNVEAVKSFDNASFELARYDQSLAVYEAIGIENEWLYSKLNIGQGAIFTVGLTINLILAAGGVLSGTLTVGSVILLSTMLQQLWVPLNFLGWQYRETKQSLIDLQNLFDILRREPKIVDAPDATELHVEGGEIVFENVSFRYPEPDGSIEFAQRLSSAPAVLKSGSPPPEQALAIDSVSFRIPAGKSLALVGSSGSGKSTTTRLLYRLYDLTGGRILIDGQDISKATIASLRQAVSIVPQDTILFNDTISYNIRYGRPAASNEEVVEAAKAASIHDVIMRMPQGYQTMVGERGVRLSGGERQRLSVARAFLKGSRIIVEDESTSALDTLTEMEVSKALEKLGVNRTRIIVAHRLSTIMNVDHIVVLRLGKKVEEGSFSELLAKPNGIFKGMWERQQKKEDEEIQLRGHDDAPGSGTHERSMNGSGVTTESETIIFE